MKIEQQIWTSKEGWAKLSDKGLHDAQLALAFGSKETVSNTELFDEIRTFYPNAEIAICSTAGEILDNKISEDTLNVTAIKFERTKIKTAKVSIGQADGSYDAGLELLQRLESDDLTYTLILSDGHIVNGSELTRALGDSLSNGSVVTGGLAGDGPHFTSTLVGLNAPPGEGNIVGVGFYGNQLKVGHAAKGGWDSFGPERVVTKSDKNVLYELDGQSALDLYKKYLGNLANELPGSALLFPLSIKNNGSTPLVRTVLSIDEEKKSMTFAGDIPEGSIARMMRSNFERLIDGASSAADSVISDFGTFEPELALLISCAGRKFALKDRVEEEVETVREVLGDETAITGFYSYGEISPVVKSTKCELHNQTMTITTLSEEL